MRLFSFAAAGWPPSPTPVGACRGVLEFERSINTAGVLSIARGHLSTVFFYHMDLKIDLRTKHNEFVRLASRVETWVMRLLKVALLRTVRC